MPHDVDVAMTFCAGRTQSTQGIFGVSAIAGYSCLDLDMLISMLLMKNVWGPSDLFIYYYIDLDSSLCSSLDTRV